MRRPQPRREAGFTLVELLVVLVIVGLLAGFGISMLTGAKEDAAIFEARALIQDVDAALELYKGDRRIGTFPPTSLEGFPGVGKLRNRTNLGIEALIVCLNSKGYRGERVLEKYEAQLDNLDADRTERPISYLASPDLFELLDPWGNPYVYFHSDDYEKPGLGRYTARAFEADGEEVQTARPWKSEKTKSFLNATGFQLFSAGPDGKFNTEDDIGNW